MSDPRPSRPPRRSGPGSSGSGARGGGSRSARPGGSGRGGPDRPRTDGSRTERTRSDGTRNDRSRGDSTRSDRSHSDGPRGDRSRSDGPRSDRTRNDRPRSDRTSGGPRGDRSDRPPSRPLTAAEQRAAEVRASRAPRTPRDPEAERAKIESRTTERWEEVDDLRSEALDATRRAAGGSGAGRTRSTPPQAAHPGARPLGSPVEPEVAAQIRAAVADRRIAERMIARFGQAQDALERDRLDEARKLVGELLRNVGGVAAVHALAGLVAYRRGRWRDAVRELEAAEQLDHDVALLPILADSYRALGRWNHVDRVWQEIREASPSQDVLAEGRIVAAGALADRGDLTGALRTMGTVSSSPKRVREHHVKLWYVLADLHDRAGNQIDAVRWFERVAAEDPEYSDVRSRLRTLGRR